MVSMSVETTDWVTTVLVLLLMTVGYAVATLFEETKLMVEFLAMTEAVTLLEVSFDEAVDIVTEDEPEAWVLTAEVVEVILETVEAIVDSPTTEDTGVARVAADDSIEEVLEATVWTAEVVAEATSVALSVADVLSPPAEVLSSPETVVSVAEVVLSSTVVVVSVVEVVLSTSELVVSRAEVVSVTDVEELVEETSMADEVIPEEDDGMALSASKL